jgi:hypothetical protein
MRPYMLAAVWIACRFAAGRLAPGWSASVLQETRKVLAGLGLPRRRAGVFYIFAWSDQTAITLRKIYTKALCRVTISCFC